MQEIGDQIVLNKGVRRAINHHRKGDCCCFCLRTKMGAQLIGFGLLLGFLEELSKPNIVRMGFKLAAVVPFIMMMVKDCAWHRQLFLYLFCLCMPAIFITNLVMYQNILADNVSFAGEMCWFSKKWVATVGGTKEENEAQEECNQADEEDQEDCEANLDQCPILPGGVLKALFVITPIVVIMNVHFAFVLFTHWKNSRMPAAQGGCDDADGPEYGEQYDEE